MTSGSIWEHPPLSHNFVDCDILLLRPPQFVGQHLGWADSKTATKQVGIDRWRGYSRKLGHCDGLVAEMATGDGGVEISEGKFSKAKIERQPRYFFWALGWCGPQTLLSFVTVTCSGQARQARRTIPVLAQNSGALLFSCSPDQFQLDNSLCAFGIRRLVSHFNGSRKDAPIITTTRMKKRTNSAFNCIQQMTRPALNHGIIQHKMCASQVQNRQVAHQSMSTTSHDVRQ